MDCPNCARVVTRKYTRGKPVRFCSPKCTRRWHGKQSAGRNRRKYRLKYKHGLTIQEYDAMSALQNGVCAICGKHPKTRNLSVDHDHNTGKIRGLLCYSCNYAIGIMRDDVDRLRRAADYLDRHV